MNLRDMHTHVVYGVDDGPKTAEGMHDMLDMAHNNGVTTIYATSHSTPGVESFPRERYESHLQEARAYCAKMGYPMRIHPGSEVLYTPALANFVERHRMPTLGSTDRVLMEFVPSVKFDEVEWAVSLLEDQGYVPILAHVERYDCLYNRKIFRLKEQHDVRYQVNCGTVLNKRGILKQRHIRRWFDTELIDYISSDMHNTAGRRCRMKEAWEALEETCSESYLMRLMSDQGGGTL